MSKLKFFRTSKSNGRSLFALLDGAHFPGVERTLFIRSLDSLADTTIEAKVYALSYFIDMMSIIGVDLDTMVSNGQLPTMAEINLYIQASNFVTDQAEEFVRARIKDRSSIRPLIVNEETVYRLIHSSTNSKLQAVGVSAFNRRIEAAYDYIKFLFKYHIKKPTHQQNESYSEILATLRSEKKRRAKAHDHANVLEKQLTEEQFNKLINIIRPDNPENPFKQSKQRNFLIVWMLIRGGFRRSGLAKTKISNMDFSGDCNKVFVTRTPNDPTDTRKRQASHKTREHIVVLPKELMLDIKDYYESSRVRYKAANEHEFIFIAEKSGENHNAGDPLSLNSYNKILEKLSEVLGFHIHPHRLRYHWHKIFERICEANELDDSDKDKIVKESMGWSRDSNMGQLYARMQTVKKMAEINLQHQKELYSAKVKK
ncbi:site-specific integrase [Aliagarivorans marinus]|uniref:site-specific integrase n=1 Tax=Aliagarivorans marinus TaxID=561965 RepID=UPI00040D30FB|nr:site-specific integrase [Aliagarivorans marinus]